MGTQTRRANRGSGGRGSLLWPALAVGLAVFVGLAAFGFARLRSGPGMPPSITSQRAGDAIPVGDLTYTYTGATYTKHRFGSVTFDVAFKVTNRTTTKRIALTPWNSDTDWPPAAAATDEHGNTYKIERGLFARVNPRQVEPGETVEMVIEVERPIPAAEWLILTVQPQPATGNQSLVVHIATATFPARQ